MAIHQSFKKKHPKPVAVWTYHNNEMLEAELLTVQWRQSSGQSNTWQKLTICSGSIMGNVCFHSATLSFMQPSAVANLILRSCHKKTNPLEAAAPTEKIDDKIAKGRHFRQINNSIWRSF